MALSALPLQALEFAMDPGLEEASRAMARVVEQFRSFDESQMKAMLGAGAGDRASIKLQELTTHLAQIHCLLWSAERADDDKRSPPAARLRDLRDAIYDMEDMVDEMQYHKLKFQVEKGAKVGSANPLFSALKFGKRLVSSSGDGASRSRFLKDLDFVASEVRNLISLLEKAKGAPSNPPLAVLDIGAPKATAVPLEDQKVFGRDNELDDILQMLIERPSSRCDQPTYEIISIVGMGGLGKTTLAHFIYNDARVNRHFDLKAWALVSDPCDKMKITKRILRSASPTYHGSTENEDTFETLQLLLNQSVSSKKLLLVLDDIREESFTNMACQEILNPLRSAESGSRILVTTRTNTVAAMLGTSHTYYLNALGTEDCWSLFKECAFGSGKIHHSTDELEQIGRKIATKLNGSPLAAKMLGGLVGATKAANDWRNILDTEFCGDTTLSSLQLSYNYLPGQLKQCFAYCSLFPKDQEFDQRDLVHQWVAQGFIQPQSGADKRMEDLAKDYFEELVSRSFFNVHRQGSKTHYSMHDLVNDFARSASEGSCFRIEQGKICDIPSTVRHLSVTADGLQGVESFCKLEKLRTLVITRSLPFFTGCFQDDLLGKTRNLRVLDLSCFNLRELPDTIGGLSHLRYLSLCGTLQRLPESVSKLLHLQSLCFSDKCSLDKLPVGTSMLVNLRHLDIDTRYIAQVAGIGRLVNLQGSVEFHVKKEGGRTLEELKGLNCLHGQLKIKGLDNVLCMEEARKAELNKKRNLRVLKLEWTSASRDIVPDADAEILENLQPHSSIMELQIKRYLGTTAPSWLQLAMLKELRSLHLTNCRSMNILPPLGLLPSLKDLHMKELCTVNRIGHEFYGKDDVAFPSLRVLVFDDFPSLLNWSDEVKGNPFPCLKRLKLIDCPKLIQVPPFPLSVSEVTVQRSLLISYMRLAPFSSSRSRSEVLTLDVCTTTVLCRELFHQHHLESIVSLMIKGCQKLVATEGLCSLTSLQRLQLCHCDLTDNTLNRILYAIPYLSSLEMMDLPNITSLLMPTELNFFTELAELHIANCQLLSSVVSLHTFISLKRLVIERCPKLTEESFPINFWSLTSLKVLSISHCKGLQSFPVGGVPASLETLHLVGCHPKLRNQSGNKKVAYLKY